MVLLIRLENITKASVKCLDSSDPHSVRQTVYKWRKFKMIAPRSGLIEEHRSQRSKKKEPEGLQNFYIDD